jgi:hypothetical protein
MNSSELGTMWQRIDFLTKKAYPTIDKSNLVNPPFIQFTLGNMYRDKTAFINSLSYTIPDDGVWETTMDGMQLPKIVEVQMEFKFVENVGAELKPYGFAISKEAVKTINNTGPKSVEASSFTAKCETTAPDIAKKKPAYAHSFNKPNLGIKIAITPKSFQTPKSVKKYRG